VAANLDDRLRLLFTCCNPTLDPDEQVALALHEACGLTFAEVARAFVMPTTTIARRVVDARAKLGRGPRELQELPAERLDDVMATLYLLFNEGYGAAGDIAAARSGDAMALTRHLRARFVDAPAELDALLALMLLHDARRLARFGADGEPVLFADQDRARWRKRQIDEGRSLARAALRRGPLGPYALQAAIAVVHSEAATAAATNWAEIAALYERLLAIQPSPVIALNHAAAVSMSQGPATALPLVDALATQLSHYCWWHATRADLLRRLQRFEEAITSYRNAHALAAPEGDRRFLRRRLAALGDTSDPP
jgi:RNA polymerase sigma-70 factor (ECF subfamily)